ncbi:MAG: STAS domain-containing protein [bacterium]
MTVPGISDSSPPLRCTIEEESGASVLHVSGELDMATAPSLDAAFRGLNEQDTHVIADLTGVSYCDMSGVRLLEQIYRDLRGRGRLLVLVTPPGIIRRVFAMIEMEKHVAIVPTRAEAHALLHRPES